jgi:hypothetical protein
MSEERPLQLDAKMQQAVSELEQTISQKYPSASFAVTRAADAPNIIHLVTTVDVDDPDEVADLVLDRVVALVADEGIPLHVIPVRTPERIQQDLAERAYNRKGRTSGRRPLFETLPFPQR